MSNLSELNRSWEEKKVNLKQKINLLNDNDLLFPAGKEEEVLDRLQIKLGKTKEELRAIVADL
jgi:uncharacterized protein YjbJ (UPF0337 family)